MSDRPLYFSFVNLNGLLRQSKLARVNGVDKAEFLHRRLHTRRSSKSASRHQTFLAHNSGDRNALAL